MPLENDHRAARRHRLPHRRRPVVQHRRRAGAEESGQLAGVRRQHRLAAPLGEPPQLTGQGVEAIRVDDQGAVDLLDQAADRVDRIGMLAQPRAEGHRPLTLQGLEHALPGLGAEPSGSGHRKRQGHALERGRLGHREQRLGHRQGDQARTRAHGRPSGEHRCPRLALRAGDHQQVAVVPLVAVGTARTEQMAQLLGREQAQVAFGRFDQRRRNTQVGNHDLSCRPGGGRKKVGDLGSRKGDGEIGADVGPGNGGAAARQPAGKIDRDPGPLGPVQLLHQRRQVPFQRPGQTGAEKGIHHQLAARAETRGPLRSLGALDLFDHQTRPAADAELHAGIASRFPAASGESYPHQVSARGQMASQRQTVAAVVSGSAEDGHRAGLGEALADRVGHADGRVLHQHQAGDAELLDRGAIDLAHGLGAEDAHRLRPPADGPR